MGTFSHLDIIWEDPGSALFLRTPASFCRPIFLDWRGGGASDPLPPDPLPPWESIAEELAAVLDEVGSERAAIMGALDAGPAATFFAATRPARTSALVLVQTTAKYVATFDGPGRGDPLCRRPQGRAARHRAPASGGAAHRRG